MNNHEEFHAGQNLSTIKSISWTTASFPRFLGEILLNIAEYMSTSHSLSLWRFWNPGRCSKFPLLLHSHLQVHSGVQRLLHHGLHLHYIFKSNACQCYKLYQQRSKTPYSRAPSNFSAHKRLRTKFWLSGNIKFQEDQLGIHHKPKLKDLQTLISYEKNHVQDVNQTLNICSCKGSTTKHCWWSDCVMRNIAVNMFMMFMLCER